MNAVALLDAQAAPVTGPSLELFSDMARTPDRFIVHAATDSHNAPLICRGDIVVVDTGGPCVTGGWYPTEGGLFPIEYRSPPSACERYARHSRRIVQTFTDQRGRWWAGGLRRGIQGRELICSDGPYSDEIALADKLIGSVIGLYRPTGVVQ
ncbi:hypothetical protein [Sphingomonas melonis]|uniref:hypothetical protein n=1 Tax=Sphingomonas melonis TaxID=152682 RepID=UPI00037D5CA7|nr:hypothetical protein [Sphingomonas melonis]